MRLLITSDIHYRLKQFDWLVDAAPGYDALVVAGDLLDLAGHVEMDVQIAVVERYLVRLSGICPTFISSGNHDGDVPVAGNEYVAQWLAHAQRPNLIVDGQSAAIDGLTITACPWWDGETTRESLEELLKREKNSISGDWAWLYHAPPQNSPLAWSGKKDFGDALLNDLIERYKPQYVFCGHVHNAPYRDEGSWIARVGSAWCFNPGFQMADVPCYVDLDTDARQAKWHSDFGEETRDLAN